MAKRKRGGSGRGPRMEDLSDLTPENLERSRRRGPAPAAFEDPARQKRWEERTAAAEARKGQRTSAPFIALAVVGLCVLGLIAWSLLRPEERLTVAGLNSPVVAATDGGSAVYPANSAEAVGEDVKFGYLPAVELQELADGTVVLGSSPQDEGGADGAAGADGEDTAASAAPGFERPYAELNSEEFAAGSIPSPEDGGRSGTPVTWADVYEDHALSTVFMPEVDTESELDAVLSAAEERERLDAVIVRTADPALAGIASAAGAPVLFTGALGGSAGSAGVGADTADPGADADSAGAGQAGAEGGAADSGADPAALAEAGFTMVALPADAEGLSAEAIGAWTDAGIEVWAAGVESEAQLQEFAEHGVFGAFAENPFAVQPSNSGD